ncbi:MAG: NAD(P)-dependent alcohol dehydrogenase [Marinoscillum sp.]|uniref:zinc-dependent alcohol dehydrogenase family protein n=1 Tax=Marinoscillum sp. TaxID=2024838 RepID=UPI0032F49498
MKAIVVRAIDQKYNLEFSEVADPILRPDHCLVKIKAAALNRRDYWISVGKYPGIKDGVILGSDGCGEVMEGDPAWIGKTVLINPNINWGDNPEHQSAQYSILGTPENGTFAEYLVIPTNRLVEKPKHLSDTEAAAFPLAALTAYRAVFRKAGIQGNQKILVTGVGGGVSQFACAFVLALGAEVYVTSSSDTKLTRMIEMGASGGFNYGNPEWVKEAGGKVNKFDAIIDSAGGNAINDYLRLIQPGGYIVVYGSTTGKTEGLDLFRLFWSQASIVGSTMGNDEEFTSMIAFISQHQIKPIVDSVHPFAQGIEAIQQMGTSSQFGKVVLEM